MTTCAVYVHTASAFVLPIASRWSACMSCRLFLDKDCVMYVSHIRCADGTHASLDLGFCSTIASANLFGAVWDHHCA